MKEYFPQRTTSRTVEPRRIITPPKKQRRSGWRRWWMTVPCLALVGAALGVGWHVYRLHQHREFLRLMIDSQHREHKRLAEDVDRWKRTADEQQSLRVNREAHIQTLEARLNQDSAFARQAEQAHQATTLSLRELETKLSAAEQQHKDRLFEIETLRKRIRDLASLAIDRFGALAETLNTDPTLVQEILSLAKQMASDYGLSGDAIDQRLQSLPKRRLLPNGSSVIASDVTMEGRQIAATVVVQNANDEFVHDLRRGDIEVRSGSRRLHAVSFHETRRTASRHEIAVLLDVSGSTTGIAHVTVKSAASQFVRTLANPNRLRVWKFADTVEPISPWSIDAELHEQAIAELTAGGGTMLYQAVKTAADSLNERHGARAIVLFTDGKDSGNGESIDATLEFCRQRSIPIHVVMLETQETDEPLLRRIATATGGTFHRAANPSQLADQFREVALSFMQPCYRLQIHESVGAGPLTLQVGELSAVPLSTQP